MSENDLIKLQANIYKLNPDEKRIIYSLKDAYSFIGLSEVEFYSLMLENIEKISNLYQGNMEVSYYVYLKDELSKILNKYMKNELESKEDINIIINYASINIKVSNDYEKNLKQFKNFGNFFKKINFKPNADLCISIINSSSNLYKLLESIVAFNSDLIKENKVRELTKNSVLQSFVVFYCMINNIDIHDDYEDDVLNNENDYDRVSSYLRRFKGPLLTHEEEYELFKKVQAGNKKAIDILVEKNQRLIVLIARRHARNPGMLDDLIQEGNIGLLKAIEGFDFTKGYKFSTYATWWITQAITRYIYNKSRNIRLPVNKHEKISKLKKARRKLLSELNREPTIEELSKELKCSKESIEDLYNIMSDTTSLNIIINEDEDTELGDIIDLSEDDDGLSNILMSDEVKALLGKCNLNERELFVIKHHFGLYDGIPKTLEEIGKLLGLTRERVRQIKEGALKKIRNSPYIKSFAEYMDKPEEAIKTIDTYRKNNYVLIRKDVNEKAGAPTEKIDSSGADKRKIKYKHTSIEKKDSSNTDNVEIKCNPIEKKGSDNTDNGEIKHEKIRNVFEFYCFKGYTKKQLDEVLLKLTGEEKELLKLFSERTDTSFGWNESRELHSVLIPKMLEMLEEKQHGVNIKKNTNVDPMPIKLYKHNKVAYEKAVLMLEKCRKFCVIMATGTGKSFIALSLIYYFFSKNLKSKTLYLTPLNGIISQFKEHIATMNLPDEMFDNVIFSSYQALITKTDEELKAMKFDFIILDEFQHIKAPEWYKKLEIIIKANPNAKIFGMSATSKRKFGTDYEEDVAKTFFEGNIAYEYDLVSAISDGVLPQPNYHCHLAVLEEDCDEFEKMINNGNFSLEEDRKYRKILANMRKKIAKGDTIEKIIKTCVKKDSKLIYFCPKGSDILALQDNLKSMLPLECLDNLEFYQVHSSKQTAKVNKLNSYNFYHNKTMDGHDANGKLRIMFAIDMYNEGIHVPDIDGVIMGRSTKSDITFHQQLGRALAVRKKEDGSDERVEPPLVIDLMGNIKEIIKLYTRAKIKRVSENSKDIDSKDNFAISFGLDEEIIEFLNAIEEIKSRKIKDINISEKKYASFCSELAPRKINPLEAHSKKELRKDIGDKEMEKNIDMNILRTEYMEELLKTLPPTQQTIMYLTLELVYEKGFSSKEIAEFFGVDESEVIKTIKEVLLEYRKIVIKRMDNSIEAVLGESIKKQRKSKNDKKQS